jgi:hypothetical protein
VLVSRRFCGPPGSGNGGYVCGLVAGELGGEAEVTLRRPPPLEQQLAVEHTGDGAVVRAGEHVVAEATATVVDVEAPPAVGYEEAVAASAGYPWATSGHPFPTCFVCGPHREPGDGLRLFPGAVPGRRVAAAPWVPDPSLVGDDGLVRPEFVWAALDCPSWFGMYCFEPLDGPMLLGRMAARVVTRPRSGDRLVALGWFLARDGRKVSTASALFDAAGDVVGLARATWITPRQD